MWVPKYERDERKGVDTPVPTQVVSNEEILPRPQHRLQKQVEALTMQMGEENAKRLGMSRRKFMLAVGAGGVATAAAVATKSPQSQQKKAEAVNGSRGYQLTEHVRKYYETAKV